MKTLAARLLAAFALLLAMVASAPAWADPTFPPLTGRVVDNAHVLSPQTQADLTAKLAALEAKTTDQVVVVTLPDLQGYPIEDYGYQLLRTWGIGQKDKNNGVLFIVVPTERKVRIEVGYGLEPVLTDGLSNIILQRAVLPKFRSGDIEGGVVGGTDAIVEQLGLTPQEAQARAQQAQAVVEQPVRRRGSPLQGLIVIIFVVLFIGSMLRGRGGGLWMLPFLFMGGGGRYRDDDFGGGGGFGGGGFSGGGGSGGGGGSSGSW